MAKSGLVRATLDTELHSNPDTGKDEQHRVTSWLKSLAPRWLKPGMVALATALAATIIAQAWLLAEIIQRAIVDATPVANLWTLLLTLAGVLGARAMLETLRGWVAAGASAQVRSTLVPQLFEHMIEAGPALRDKHGSGALSTTLIEQVDALDPFYARYLPQVATVSVLIPAILFAVFASDWLAGLFLLLTAPLIPFFMILIGMGTEALSQRQQLALARLSGVFLDRLRGLDMIRRFGAEQRELQQVSGLIEEFRVRTMSVLRVAFLSTAVLEFFSAVAIAAIAIYIGLGLLGYIEFGPAPHLDLKTGLFVLLLAPEFFSPLRQLSQFWHDRASALAAAGDIRQLLATPAARTEPEIPIRVVGDTTGAIRIANLTLSRPGRGRVLDNVNLLVRGGERVLITGASGSGKSTLLHLLAGLLDADGGSIHINDMPLERIDRSNLARLRGWMGQRTALINGSLADNLRLGLSHADEVQLQRALELAGLADFVRQLPKGIHSPITQDGEGLSGGQARRLVLARALLGQPPLLLLDEPTASLDAESAAAIWRTLERIGGETGQTMICASHEPAARQWADRTYQMLDGKLEELQP